ncbi:MAG: PEP-CTERM sorting domain-containing protein [Planctomycetales bacterium]|nr:PEP-CTERM sorting domain-containing protein [Planctomycetales bacterium]
MKRNQLSRLFGVIIAALACCVATANAELVGSWQFDGDANDSSGKGNHGTLENGASLSSDTPTGTGQSLSLAGGEQHVLVPHDSSLDITSAITISAWVKTANVGWDAIVGKTPSDGSSANHAGNYELRIDRDNENRGVNFGYQRGGVDDSTFHLNQAVSMPTDKWTHLAVTAEAGGEVNYYLDGALAGTHETLVDVNFGAPNTSPLYIGSRADLFTTMDGLLDDVRIYNEVLSAGDIAALVPEPSAGLLCLLGVAALIRRRRR